MKRVVQGLKTLAGMASRDRTIAVANVERLLGYHLGKMGHEERERHVECSPYLTDEHMKGSRIYPDRWSMARCLPVDCVGAEIGSYTGYFTAHLAEVARPRELHIFDLDFARFPEDDISRKLAPAKLIKHLGDSSSNLDALAEHYFDWIYVDGDHGYAGVARDLLAADRTLKPGGLMMCNDYTNWSSLEGRPYGVARAINEFILKSNYRMEGYAFHHAGNGDVLLRKPA
jgi:hypothetical protein